jgi:hypothetical protein
MSPALDLLRICAMRSCGMRQNGAGRVPLRPTQTPSREAPSLTAHIGATTIAAL